MRHAGTPHPLPTRRTLLACSLLLPLAACSGTRSDDHMENLSPAPATTAPHQGPGRAAPDTDLRPALVVSGTPVSWDDLWNPLAEYAGGVVVAELVLDTLLEAQTTRLGLTITPRDVEAERAALTRTITQGVGVPDDQAQQLVQQVTRARALGPARMQALLRRNAMLRALARTTVTTTDEALRTAYDIEHGRRYIARLITTPTQREAASLRDSIAAGDPAGLRARFAEAAVASSTDPSGAAGGLLGPISPSDTTLPAALRAALGATPAGSLSQVLALDDSFAIAYIESTIEPDPISFEAARPRLEPLVQERLERLQMDVIAREMLAGAQVSVFDRSLNWGWENARAR